MTATTKPVSRVTEREYSVEYANRPRQIIVTVGPGDVLQFREQRSRQTWTLPIDFAMRQAILKVAKAQAS